MIDSKQKGNRVEREIVNLFQENGINAKRAWGSNGQSLGEHEEVDVLVKLKNRKYKLQVKARKAIADYIIPNLKVVDCQVIKQNRTEPFVVLPLIEFIKMIKE